MYCTFQNIHIFKNIIKIINLQYFEDSNLKKNTIFNTLKIQILKKKSNLQYIADS